MRRLSALLLALAVPLALAACGDGKKAEAGGTAPPPPEVTVAKPLVRKLTEWDEYTGRFEAVQQVEIRARVAGYLQEIRFQDGQAVEAGQLLFVIDPRPYQAAADQAGAQIAQAEAQLKLSQLDQARTAQLVATSAAAKATLDQRNAELQSAEANLASLQAQQRQAQLNVEFTQVKAPFKGRISNRRVDLGNLVSDQTLLTTIVQLDPIYLTFDMSESDFLTYERAVAEGRLPSTRERETIVDAHLVDENDWKHQGAMNFVDNVVNQGSGTIRGRAVFPNPDSLITPGQFGRIRIPGSAEYDALLIPDAAIVTDQSRKLVMTVDGDGKVTPKIVKAGPSQPGGLRIVRDGLGRDDRIVINGLIKARPGSKVTPKDGSVEADPSRPAETASAG